MPYLAILGRQPAISLAELISLYPHQVQAVGNEAALIEADTVEIDRLGGSIKLVQILETLRNTNLKEVVDHLAKILPPHLSEGKIPLGLSLHGFNISPKSAFAAGLDLKKRLRKTGLSIRIIPGMHMDAAQIIHNHLLSNGADVVVVASAGTCHIGLTRQIQDIQAYGMRDHGRPFRSAKVGMLPPKLAQIMINLASPSPGTTVLDPFCGTGVVIQEALLMKFPTIGTDISGDLIKMTQGNLNWLANQYEAIPLYDLAIGDATAMHWTGPIGAVVTEGYLGPALSATPTQEEIKQLTASAKELTLNFFKNLAPQLTSATPVCITLPAWRQGKQFERLNIIDQIEALGYTLKQLLPVLQTDMLYARTHQIVGREIVTLIKN